MNMNQDLITTISFSEYRKNLQANLPYRAPYVDLLVHFPSQIAITRSGIKNCFTNKRYNLLEELLSGLPKENQSEFVEEFYKNLPSLGTEARWPVFTFVEKFVAASTDQQLVDNMQYILVHFKTTKKFLQDLAKKLAKTENSDVVYAIYNHTKDVKLKKEILKYLPTAAVALSESDIELRERAKKSLGMSKGRNINYRNRLRQAFKKALEKGFPSGTIKKYSTCTLSFPSSGPVTTGSKMELKTVRVDWCDSSYYIKTDSNRLYFKIDVYLKNSKYYYGSTRYEMYDSMDLDCARIERSNGGYAWAISVHKNDWKKLVEWIEKKLVMKIMEL